MRRRPTIFAATIVLALATLPAAAGHFHSCESLNYITHGTFHELDGCVQFVDDTGVSFEIANRGSWKDGMSGTIYAEIVAPGSCGQELTAQVCDWDADYSRNVVGTLVFLNFIECPGYYIRQAGQTVNLDYYIRNHDDFPELFVQDNVGRKLKAEVVVNTSVTNCLGKNVSHLVDYDFLPQK